MKKLSKKGQVAGIITLVVSLVVGIIMLIGVFTPIIGDLVENKESTERDFNFTGVDKTLTSNLTTFVLLGVLVLIAGIAVYGFSKQ